MRWRAALAEGVAEGVRGCGAAVRASAHRRGEDRTGQDCAGPTRRMELRDDTELAEVLEA